MDLRRGRRLLALALQEAWPVRRALDQVPDRPARCQRLTFLRLHDELSLERLDEDERRAVFERWAPDPRDRLYGRGLRRRLPPLLADDRRYRLALDLLFALPSAPGLLWGEELGMGDNRTLPGRPMPDARRGARRPASRPPHPSTWSGPCPTNPGTGPRTA